MNLLDHPLITQRYFFPRVDPPTHPLVVQSHGESLQCSLHRTQSASTTVLFFHGNGEIVADYEPWFADALQRFGVDTFLAEYRGYGGSSGLPTLGTMLDDVDALVRAAAPSPEQLVVFGRSIGSIFAVETARQFPSIRGLILESAIADVRERIAMRMTPAELRTDEASLAAAIDAQVHQCRKLAAFPGPSLILHARGDSIVDVSHAERLAQAAGDRGRLVLLPRGDHNNVMWANEREYWHEVGAFLART